MNAKVRAREPARRDAQGVDPCAMRRRRNTVWAEANVRAVVKGVPTRSVAIIIDGEVIRECEEHRAAGKAERVKQSDDESDDLRSNEQRAGNRRAEWDCGCGCGIMLGRRDAMYLRRTDTTREDEEGYARETGYS